MLACCANTEPPNISDEAASAQLSFFKVRPEVFICLDSLYSLSAAVPRILLFYFSFLRASFQPGFHDLCSDADLPSGLFYPDDFATAFQEEFPRGVVELQREMNRATACHVHVRFEKDPGR